MNERQPLTQPVEGTPESETPEQAQRFKALAVRLEEGLHAQLRFIAQLNDTSIADEIRRAVEQRVASAQEDPGLIARADRVREEIEREAAARSAAIAGFLGRPAVATTVTAKRSSTK